jgi:hypothetical protein
MAAIEQKGNGDAKGVIRGLFHPPGLRGQDTKKGVFDAFITSNEDNPTKSRIPDPAGMMVFQLFGLWGSTKKKFSYNVQGKPQNFDKTVEGLHKVAKQLYDEDAISFDGESRDEAVTAAMGYYLQDIEDIQNAKSNRVLEAGGASKKK